MLLLEAAVSKRTRDEQIVPAASVVWCGSLVDAWLRVRLAILAPASG